MTEERRAYMRAYVEANRARIRRQKYASARGFKVGHTEEEWLAKVALFGNACAYCRTVMDKLERDHVVPIGLASPETVDLIENVVPACRSCNARKAGRNVLAGPRSVPVPKRACPICGGPIRTPTRGQPYRTCSQECRREWSRRNPTTYSAERIAAQRDGIRRARESKSVHSVREDDGIIKPSRAVVQDEPVGVVG